MTILRRIVFGEPYPGGSQFAGILARGLAESVSYCNRTGPMGHDRVTDFPLPYPRIGINLVKPTAPLFVAALPSAADVARDALFAWHHMPLYHQGVQAVPAVDPLHVECARLCRAIYAYPGDEPEPWDVRLDTAGVAWGIRFQDKRAKVVFRGSDVFRDWILDITPIDPARILTHDAFGLMWGGFQIGMPESCAAIKPYIADCDEIVFTGHSLGADHADSAAAYAIIATGA